MNGSKRILKAMDNQQKLYGALGLSRRAGKCIAGDFAVEKAVKSGTAGLVVLDSSVSDATRKRYQTMCSGRGIDCIEVSDMGAAIGKPGGKIAAITDQRFIHMICSAATQENSNTNQNLHE